MNRFSWLFCLACIFLACGSNPVVDPGTSDLRLSVSDYTGFEGDGESVFTFQVILNKSATQDITIDYTSESGSAKAGSDFEAENGTVQIPAGERGAVIEVKVVGDTLREYDEQFTVRIVEAGDIEIADGEATGTIRNDDTYLFIPDDGYITPIEYPDYNLVWSDEFEGDAVDLENWTYETGGNWFNNELQHYTDRSKNSFVDQGKLVIEAYEEEYEGNSYTSARMITQNKQEFKFGRIDVRATLPQGQGIWPAIWMLGASHSSVGWPACGEIDIMELIGHEPDQVHGTAHWGPQGQSWSFSKSASTSLDEGIFADQFHVFSIIWSEDEIVWLVDDEEFGTVRRNDVNGNYPFNDRFFFILNVAVGGNWPGNPDATTVFPQRMTIDYVRVFQPK